MGSRMKAKLVCDALTMAIWQRNPKAGLVVHSDRGSQLRYITTFYNPERLHSYLDYRSPNQYEADMKKLKKVA